MMLKLIMATLQRSIFTSGCLIIFSFRQVRNVRKLSKINQYVVCKVSSRMKAKLVVSHLPNTQSLSYSLEAINSAGTPFFHLSYSIFIQLLVDKFLQMFLVLSVIFKPCSLVPALKKSLFILSIPHNFVHCDYFYFLLLPSLACN